MEGVISINGISVLQGKYGILKIAGTIALEIINGIVHITGTGLITAPKK